MLHAARAAVAQHIYHYSVHQLSFFSLEISPPVGKPGLYEQIESYSMKTTLPQIPKIDSFCSPFFYASSTQGKLQSGGYTHLTLFSRKNLW
jgi:hypothetical protein